MIKVMSVFGTRPEAIKMAPLVKALENEKSIKSLVCVSGQHRDMLDSVLSFFKIIPDYDLNVMKEAQSLAGVTSRILVALTEVLDKEKPDLVLVHGDTNTTISSSLAAFYNQIPVGHVEAGLRTGNILSPWPEEANRMLTGVLAKFHFAPTEVSKNNLLAEGKLEQNIYVTGNTVIDALLLARQIIQNDESLLSAAQKKFSFLDSHKKLILVTGHRRENHGDGFVEICAALAEVAERDDVEIVYPVHLNPNVKGPVHAYLSNKKSIHLIEPQDYPDFVYLMDQAFIILTDSGGIQEEAPSLGKPVLVMRDTTERPEAVDAGTVKLVGTNRNKIITELSNLLDNDTAYRAMSLANNPFGNGTASQKIKDIILNA